MDDKASIAVIGGSGLYNMPDISDTYEAEIDTPFGSPSGKIVVGSLRGKRVAFLARHGHGHFLTPGEVPYRANIYALKSLGVKFIIAVNACGSLREDYEPGSIVIPDQLFDNTRSDRGGRTFFEGGIVGHVSVADPFCPDLAEILVKGAQQAGANVRQGGTFIIIEGPRFSAKGESHIYRQWGCSIIGMTSIPEAFLAREAEISYASMAHVTDYDVWHTSEEPVTVEMVINTLRNNVTNAQQSIANAVAILDEAAQFPSHTSLDGAIMTAQELIPSEIADKLSPIIGRVTKPNSS